MTLDVICDVSIGGEIKSLDKLKPVLFETLESVIENMDLAIENYEVLNNDPDYVQVFFSTRYEAPISAIKYLSLEYADLVFILTYDDQNGNDGRIKFYGESEKRLEYVSEFRYCFKEWGLLKKDTDHPKFRELLVNRAACVSSLEFSVTERDVKTKMVKIKI
jgi:hypothetical protein